MTFTGISSLQPNTSVYLHLSVFSPSFAFAFALSSHLSPLLQLHHFLNAYLLCFSPSFHSLLLTFFLSFFCLSLSSISLFPSLPISSPSPSPPPSPARFPLPLVL
ncbi:hypothetical protein NL108_013607 [Boleophthalmus pectinirostris]|nr:hypothetical protein NL108_013607 [Boleophthalmus pectinirostris]